MTTLHMLRVFCDPAGRHGNRLGVILDGAAIAPGRRQSLAAELGYPETVYLDDPATGTLQIFTPAAELPLAGHPLVGTGWLLNQRTGTPVRDLNPPAGPVPTWAESGLTWIRAPLAAAPPWVLHRVSEPASVEAMTEPPRPDQDADQFWAWVDEEAGIVRARVFAARYGIHEDEACGSACLLLAGHTGRALTIHHGAGSLVHARPADDGLAEIGGSVVLDGVRDVT